MAQKALHTVGQGNPVKATVFEGSKSKGRLEGQSHIDEVREPQTVCPREFEHS